MNVTSLGRLCCWPRSRDRDSAVRGSGESGTPTSLLEEVMHRRDWGPGGGDRPPTPPPDPDLGPDLVSDTPRPGPDLVQSETRLRVCSDGEILLAGPTRPESGAFSESEVQWQKELSPPEPCSETAI